MAKRELFTGVNEEDGFDLFMQDDITCPYCGYKDRDGWEYDNDADTIECNSCGEEFFYERVTEISYTTRKPLEEYEADDR